MMSFFNKTVVVFKLHVEDLENVCLIGLKLATSQD